MTRLRILLAAATVFVLAGCGATRATPVPPPADRVPAPTAISIPAIDTQSDLIRLGVNPDKTVQVPDVKTPEQAGWFAFSSKPGDPGPAVILGHVDGHGKPGVFYHLKNLKPGDDVVVTRADGSKLTYDVTQVWKAEKDKFPTDEVYGNTAGSELRLITCGGEWVGGEYGYANNIIADAVLTS